MLNVVTKNVNRDCKGGINHNPPMEDSYLMKMYSYFDIQDRIKLQQKVSAICYILDPKGGRIFLR